MDQENGFLQEALMVLLKGIFDNQVDAYRYLIFGNFIVTEELMLYSHGCNNVSITTAPVIDGVKVKNSIILLRSCALIIK